jgi:arginase
MARTIHLIGAPSSAGAYAPGQEKAPQAFRQHGLVPALRAAGCTVHDEGDAPLFRWRPDRANPLAMNLDAVRDTCFSVAQRVSGALQSGGHALVLGGDCTIELGTVAGALAAGGSVGLVYIDLDVDLNPPRSSDGALDWTGVAHLLDLPGTEPALSGLGPRRPMLAAQDILYFGIDNIERDEARTLRERALRQLTLNDVQADPQAAAREAVAWAAQYDNLLVHLDVDVLSYVDFPIAENVRRVNGLTLAQLSAALNVLLAAPGWRALTVAEVNPDHAPDEAEAFDALIAVLTRALGQ